MRQETLAGGVYEKYRKKTRKEHFLEGMELIIPWKEVRAEIEPFYPNPVGAGRRPIGIDRMLRIHFLQHWFNLTEPAPDETTICKFRHLMEKRNLGDRLFDLANEYLADNGLGVAREYDRGCHDHRGREFDEEQGKGP